MKTLFVIVVLATFLGTTAATDFTTNAPPSGRPILVTCIFRLDTKAFLHNLWNQAKTNEFQEHVILKNYLKRKGLEIVPPSSMFFNDREGTLYVRSTETNLQKLAPLVAALNERK
jgi:hypothetical protein